MSEAQVFEVQCAECEEGFQIDSTQAGTTVHCPHCGSPSEIPTMAEIMGEEPDDEEVLDAEPRPVAKLANKAPREPSGPKKRRRPPESSGGGGRPAGREGGLVKAVSAKRSAQMLLKLSNYFYYISFFILAAWSFKVVGALYPIVNSKKGSYLYWMIESTVATAWAATYIALLIGLAELIKVVLFIYQEDSDE